MAVPTESLAAVGINVLELSRRALAVLVFGEIKSQNREYALSVARGALNFRQVTFGKETVRIIAFGKDAQEAARAVTLLDLASNWSSSRVFARGRVVPIAQAISTIRCFTEACACADPKAHCLIVREGIFDNFYSYAMATAAQSYKPDDERTKRFVMPCRLALKNAQLQYHHPSKWRDQVQQIAVTKGTDWCPRFDLSEFRRYA